MVSGNVAIPAGDPREPSTLLLRDLRTTPDGLSGREAARRLEAYGPNELVRRAGRDWPKQLLRQFTHPLALLLWQDHPSRPARCHPRQWRPAGPQ